jgi:hypothetical protein
VFPVRANRILLFVSLSSALLACNKGSASHSDGGGGGGGGDAGAPPIPLANLCQVFTDDLCIYLMQCNGAPYKDMNHCRAELDCYGLPDLMMSAADGGVIYDPSKVGACHARFLADPCHFDFFLFTPDIFQVLADCPGTITPERNAGDACISNGECKQGLYCHKMNSTCPGVCTAYAQAGEPCPTPDIQCASQTICRSADNLCHPFAKASDPCTTISDCGPTIICINDPTCVNDNLWCDVTAGVCKVGGGVGAACGPQMSGDVTDQAYCASDLWCDDVFLDTAGTCRASDGTQGSPCNDRGGCQKGLHCAGYVPFGTGATLGTCAPPAPSGAACSIASDCQTGLRCIGQLCAAPGGLGAGCSADADCQTGFTCPNLHCLAARYPGDPCGDADSACVLSLCKNGMCVDHTKVGQPCTADGDCTTGACVSGTCADTSVCRSRSTGPDASSQD